MSEACNCPCGCEVPVLGTCVDCGDNTHQNNNNLVRYQPQGSTYEFRGTYIYMVEADSEEEAKQKRDEALNAVLWEWTDDDE